MENTPWKPIFIAAGASLILLLLVYIIVLPKSMPGPETQGKIAEWKNTRVAGHEEGIKKWEFTALSGWSEKDGLTTYLENVINGNLYNKNGELLTKNLTAPIVKANQRSKLIEAFGNTTKQVTAEITFAPKAEKKKRKFARISADSLNYSSEQKKTTLHGNIKIIEKGIAMASQDITIDHDRELAILSGSIEVVRRDINLFCDNMVYEANGEKFSASGNIRSRIKAKQKTNFNAANMLFYADENKDLEAMGSIEATQGKKVAVAQFAIYNKSKKLLMLSGKVKAVINKGRALIDETLIKELENPDAKKLLEAKTFISSDKLAFSTLNGDALAEGNVVVTQKGRAAKAGAANYNDQTDVITLIDNVYMKKDRVWIKCEKVEVSVKHETFTATGSIEAEFKIKKR